MPDDSSKIVLELELEVKKLTKDVDKVEKSLENFVKKSVKLQEKMLDSLDEMVSLFKDIQKGAKGAGDAVAAAANKQEKAAKKTNEELKKTEGFLKRFKSWAKEQAKPENQGVIGRFFGGFARGTGAAGIAGTFTRPNRAGRLGGAIGRGLIGAGAGVGGFLMGGMQQAYGTYVQRQMAMYGMTGLGTPGQFRRGRRLGAGLGFAGTETAMLAPGAAAATGNLRSVGLAQQLAIGGGFGPGRIGEAMAFMGTMRQAGQSFTGAQNQKTAQRDLSKMVAAGMFSGLEKARLPEFFGSVQGLVQSQFATAAGKVDSISIAKQLADLGRRGGAGFQGERGARIMGQLDAMIRRPGGGEAGQAVILQAMGFGRPGGGTNYYDALKMQQKGIRDPNNVKRVMEEVYRQRGVVTAGGSDPRNREANLQFSALSGLSLEIVEKLKDIHATNKTDEKKQKEIEKVLKTAEPIDKQALRVAKEGFAAMKKHFAGVEEMQVSAGQKVAKPMLQLQHLQMQAIVDFSKHLPAIIEWLKKIYELIIKVAALVKSNRWENYEANLKKITEEFIDKEEKIKSRQIKTLDDFVGQQADLATTRQQELLRRSAEIAGQGSDFSREYKKIHGDIQKDPAVAGPTGLARAALQLGGLLKIARGEGEAETLMKDPAFVARMTRVARMEDAPGYEEARLKLFGPAADKALRRIENKQRQQQVRTNLEKTIYGQPGTVAPTGTAQDAAQYGKANILPAAPPVKKGGIRVHKSQAATTGNVPLGN